MSSRWHRQAAECARRGMPFPIHGLPNSEIAELLHGLAHREGPGALRMLFGDGSQSAPFPLPPLRLPTGIGPLWKEGTRRLLRVGLISRRHPLMDFAVDMYLLRNAEAKGESYAGTEERACLAARQLLDEAVGVAGSAGLLLEFYQTGLEPAVVGFWRGVCETLRDHPDWPVLARPRSKKRNVLTSVDGGPPDQVERLCTEYPDFFQLEDRGGKSGSGRVRDLGPAPPEDEESFARKIWRAVDLDSIDDVAESEDPDGEAPPSGAASAALRWLPERPMRQDECDTIVGAFPALEAVVNLLFEGAQYSYGSEWGR